MATIKLIYVGDDLYMRSGTFMSSIYTEDRHRFDWGFAQLALKRGDSIEIRQGTPAERAAVIQDFIERGGKLKEEVAS